MAIWSLFPIVIITYEIVHVLLPKDLLPLTAQTARFVFFFPCVAAGLSRDNALFLF
jgi:hypothetical protein